MKFKELIEKYAADGKSKEWELMINGCMPLTPSIMKEFERFIPETYHVTSFGKVKQVLKLQGKQIDLPTFTKGSYGLSQGAREETDILFKLEGYSSFDGDVDFESLLDRNGHRWLEPLKDKDMVVNNKFTVKMNQEIVKEYDLDDRHSISKTVNAMSGKEKSKFINFYYKTAKKLTTKDLINALKDSISRMYQGTFSNNEVLLHNYKILEVLVVSDSNSPEIMKTFEDLAKQKKIKIDGVIQREKIEKIGA